jgi:hypothetical protein
MRSEARPSNPVLFRPKPTLGRGWGIFRWCCEHPFLVALGIPFLVVNGCIATVVVNASFEQGAALDRARAIPQAEREKMLRACVEISREIKPDEYERIFGESPRNKPIPPEFAALQAKRVNVKKDRASVKLQFCFDNGTFLYVEGLDTASPSAHLFWGEHPGSEEDWAVLKGGP